MNIIDLFSGAGGLTEGFRTTPFNIKVHVEMDKAACCTLQLRDVFYYLKQQNNLDLYKDFLLEKIDRTELLANVPNSILDKTINIEINDTTIQKIFDAIDSKMGINQKIDGIIGGPPCQAYSTIGRALNKPKKSSDERIYLYRYYIDFLNKYRPKFFIFENVKGLLSFKDQTDKLLLPNMIKEFNKAGYNLSYKLIDSSNFGIPQKRERLIIFGTNNGLNPESFFNQLFDHESEKPVTIGKLFQDLPKLKSGHEVNRYGLNHPNEFVTNHIRKNKNLPLIQNISRPHTLNDLKIYKEVATAKNNGINLKYTDIKYGDLTHKNKHSFLDRYKALDKNAISHTIVAHIAKDGHYYIHYDTEQNRSITVREAARIQTFPDDFYFETSRTQAFKQIGNAVPPMLSEKFAKVIKTIL